jgi:hypothetical protein
MPNEWMSDEWIGEDVAEHGRNLRSYSTFNFRENRENLRDFPVNFYLYYITLSLENEYIISNR